MLLNSFRERFLKIRECDLFFACHCPAVLTIFAGQGGEPHFPVRRGASIHAGFSLSRQGVQFTKSWTILRYLQHFIFTMFPDKGRSDMALEKTVYDEEDRFLSFPSFIVSLSISYRNALSMCFFFCEIFRGQLLSKTTPVSKFDNISANCAWLRGFLGYEIIWSDPVCTWSEGPCTWCRTGGMPSATACTLGRGLSTMLKGRQHQQ